MTAGAPARLTALLAPCGDFSLGSRLAAASGALDSGRIEFLGVRTGAILSD
jgi:hypothetical protein